MRFLKWHFSEWEIWIILLGLSVITIVFYFFGTATQFLWVMFGSLIFNGGIMWGNYKYFKKYRL